MSLVRDRLPEPASYFESRGLALQGRGKWRTARCEAHGGSDSLRVNLESGAFVCMAGCGSRGGDVVAYEMAVAGQGFVSACKSLGAWQDDVGDQRIARRRPLPFPARDALEILADEATLVAIAAGNIAQGSPLSNDDRERVLVSANRIRKIQEACA